MAPPSHPERGGKVEPNKRRPYTTMKQGRRRRLRMISLHPPPPRKQPVKHQPLNNILYLLLTLRRLMMKVCQLPRRPDQQRLQSSANNRVYLSSQRNLIRITTLDPILGNSRFSKGTAKSTARSSSHLSWRLIIGLRSINNI
jgi:hypothetical protein